MKLHRSARLAVLASALASVLSPVARGQGAAALFTGGFENFGGGTRFEATFDLDGDGDLDGISWWWNNCHSFNNCTRIWLRAFRNTGSGELQLMNGTGQQIDLLGWLDHFEPAVWTGDLDGDPSTCEMVFYRGAYFYVVQLWIDPAVSQQRTVVLQQTETFPACNSNWISNERAITVDDYNADGRLDVALTNGTQLFLMLQQPSSFSFVEGPSIQIKPSLPCSTSSGQGGFKLDLESAELNGDGRPDIVAVRQQYLSWNNHWSQPELIHVPLAGGQFFPVTVQGLDVGPAARVTLGDVDGDGDTDGVIFGRAGYQVWRRVAADTLVLEPLRAGGPATDLFDLDGDGDLDGICCGGSTGGPISNTSPSQFELCLNDGTGRFDDSVSFPSVGAHHVAGVLDLDGDGDHDLLGGRTILINHLRTGAPFCLAGQNSTGGFARMSVSGEASLSRSNLELRAVGLPPSTLGLFFTGHAELAPGTPLGGGHLCLGGALRRLPAVAATAQGEALFPLDLNNASLLGALPAPGDALRFQFWFRDGAGGSNTTAGLRLVVAP